ncbi:hypothetical protein I3V23_11085 [Rhodobacterales bacterium HKCCA1288]|nr:hypothetical protein I3V23_11085 [Rhodobacterales bacterium HKCCA1288]
MSLPRLTEFDDLVARFLEWHYIRALYLDNDDAAMAKAYPHAKKQLKKWEVAFISLPKDAWAKGFFMSIVGPEAWQGAEIADDANMEMAMMHHRMAIGMPWTADQGLAYEYQKKLERQAEKDDAFSDLAKALPNAVTQYKAKKNADTKRFSNLNPKAQEQEINASLDRDFYAQAIVKAAQAEGVDITKPEHRELIETVISELDALQPDPSSEFEMQNVIKKMLLHIGVIGAETPPWQQSPRPANEAPIKDDTVIMSAESSADPTEEAKRYINTVIKSAMAPVSKSKKRQVTPVEQPAPRAKTLRVEKALLNPQNAKDRSRYKSAYFLWGQIKSKPYEIDEQFKMTDSQASEWAGVAKGQHTKDVIKVLVDVRAIERIKGTLYYRRLA